MSLRLQLLAAFAYVLLLIIGCGIALGRQSDPVVTSASPTNH